MICAWEPLLSVLPRRLREDVDKIGRKAMQELRLRINAPPEVVLPSGSHWLEGNVTQEELNAVVNAASRYSPWAASGIQQGFLTAPGGHRIGLCGEAVCKHAAAEGIREISSLCIRVARDFPGIARGLERITGSVLILGAPGWGKTTLLRDLIRQRAQREAVVVIDQRGELFPRGFSRGQRTDVLSGCPKGQGVLMALRAMSPGTIAVDEITAQEDIQGLLQAANCGVHLLATAHGTRLEDLRLRPAYRQLLEAQVFDTMVLLRKDRSYRIEGVSPCC